MNPNKSMLEQFSYEHRQALLREAEQRRKMAVKEPVLPPQRLHRLASKLGGYLVAFGTRLQGAQTIE